MKLAEVDELTERISSTVDSLRKNISTIDQLKSEIEQGAKDALSHLALNR